MASVMQLNRVRAFHPYSKRRSERPISSHNAPLVKFASPKCCAQGNQSPTETLNHPQEEDQINNNVEGKESRRRMQADSTDWIASSLTRRFGLGAGLAWFGFLAFGVISEQIKTRLEASQEQQNIRDVENAQEVILPNGIKYVDLRVGGGSSPKTGDLVVIGLQGKVKSTGYVFVDTFSGRKSSLAFLFGFRPYTKGICEGIEYVMKTMKTGGKRRVVIPPELGFGKTGANLDGEILIPPEATLEYVVELQKVSIPPS